MTAAASVGTAVLLPPLVPRVLDTVREAKLSEERRVRAESAEHFRTMVDALPEIAWTASAEGAVDYYNRRWFECTGLPVEGGRGDGWKNVVHPADQERTAEAWLGSVETGEPYEITHRVRQADGSHRWLLSRGRPVRDAGGSIRLWVGSATDVDAQIRAQDDLRVARDEAERANRAKGEFLSIMSHELRTPLNAIGGYVDLMEAGIQGPITEAQAKGLDRVKANQRHLLTLINDILHFARIEAGHLEVTAQAVTLATLLTEISESIEPQLLAARLNYVCAPAEPALVARADPDRVRQILVNLLGNAVKFTPVGGRVEVDCDGTDEVVRLRVRDTGRGIPAEMIRKIFDPFVQIRDKRTNGDSSRQGVGLGLAISRDLAEAMEGKLTVESTPGHGSTFTLTLPRWRGDVAAAVRADRAEAADG